MPNGASAWYVPSSQSRFAATRRGLSRCVHDVSLSIRNAASRCTNAVAAGSTRPMAPPHAKIVTPAPPGLVLPGQRSTRAIAVSIPAAGSGPERNRDLAANLPAGTLRASTAWAAT